MKSDESRRIGVIGGGLGGLAAACTLAARGYSVVVFEKSSWLGGKAAVLERAGFRFDMGPTILTVPSVLRRIFDEAGRELDDYLDLVRLDPQWRCFFHDGSTLDLVENVDAMAANLEPFSSGSVGGYREFLDYSKRLHRISERYFFWRSVGGIGDMIDPRFGFSLSVLGDVLSMRMGRSVASRCESTFLITRRADARPFHAVRRLVPNSRRPCLQHRAHADRRGIWYPRGGTRGSPEALVSSGAELGVEYRTETGIARW